MEWLNMKIDSSSPELKNATRRNFLMQVSLGTTAAVVGLNSNEGLAQSPAERETGTAKQGRKLSSARRAKQSHRPNIIFIMADQLGARFVGCYGSGVDSTPTLDRLAREGLRFDRFYASAPVCAPNRASILTGRSPEIHGIVTNNLALQSDNPTFAHLLREEGYRTAMFGKIHQTPMQWQPAMDLDHLGFDEHQVCEDPRWGPYIDWVKKNHPRHYDIALAATNAHSGTVIATNPFETQQGASAEQVRIKKEAFAKYMQPRLDASEWERMYVSPLPVEIHDTTYITECSLDFLKRASAVQPFLCHISYVDPHDPYEPSEPYASMYDPEKMPDALPAEWVDKGPKILEQVRDGYLHFRKICDKPAAVRKLRALYHGSIRQIDDQIGRLVAYLKESGLWENTIIVFTTDHGEMMGDHGLIAKGLPHYDTGIRCPLIVAGGPVRNRGAMAQLSCSLDLFPTLCDWAGVENQPPHEGRSFAALTATDGKAPGWPEIAVSISNVDSVITEDGWRLTRYSGSDEGQMFCLKQDPDERHDLYHDPQYMDKKVELLERLVKVRMQPRILEQYRNLPVRDGRKWDPNAQKTTWPLIPLKPSPWLENVAKPAWHGTD
jgi:arylsulfatase A-like enzyme